MRLASTMIILPVVLFGCAMDPVASQTGTLSCTSEDQARSQVLDHFQRLALMGLPDSAGQLPLPSFGRVSVSDLHPVPAKGERGMEVYEFHLRQGDDLWRISASYNQSCALFLSWVEE